MCFPFYSVENGLFVFLFNICYMRVVECTLAEPYPCAVSVKIMYKRLTWSTMRLQYYHKGVWASSSAVVQNWKKWGFDLNHRRNFFFFLVPNGTKAFFCDWGYKYNVGHVKYNMGQGNRVRQQRRKRSQRQQVFSIIVLTKSLFASNVLHSIIVYVIVIVSSGSFERKKSFLYFEYICTPR